MHHKSKQRRQKAWDEGVVPGDISGGKDSVLAIILFMHKFLSFKVAPGSLVKMQKI